MNLNEQLRSWAKEHGVTFSRHEFGEMVSLYCEERREDGCLNEAGRFVHQSEFKDPVFDPTLDIYRDLLHNIIDYRKAHA